MCALQDVMVQSLNPFFFMVCRAVKEVISGAAVTVPLLLLHGMQAVKEVDSGAAVIEALFFMVRRQ